MRRLISRRCAFFTMRGSNNAKRWTRRRIALRLFTNRYVGGEDTYLQVITGQTAALANQRNDVDILRRRMEASIQLVKALGGGWDVSCLPKLKKWFPGEVRSYPLDNDPLSCLGRVAAYGIVTDLLLCGHQPLRVGPPGWPCLSTQARPIAAASSGVSQDHSAPRARIAIQRVSPRTECSSTEYGPTIGDIKQNLQ
jgi:hypothetical protein